MRFRFLTLLILLVAATAGQHLYAQDIVVKRSSVIENYKGKPYYIHFVSKGETVTSIAKAYNVSVEELGAENPVIEQGLKADMVIRIPFKSVIEIPEIGTPSKVSKPESTKPTEKPKAQINPASDPNFILYQVKKQETLYGISKQFNVSTDDIINANPGFDGLKDGMEIRIPKKKKSEKVVVIEVPDEKVTKTAPGPDEIIVKTGETLYSIGKANNVSVDELINLNPQVSGGLKAGMVLRIRKSTEKSATKTIIKNEQETQVIPGVSVSYYNADNIKNTYKIALILPLLLDDASAALDAQEQKDPSDFENFNYFQFYAGFMMAADSLEKYGLKARIQVIDGDKLNDTLTIRQTLRKPGLDKMDMIVGPMYANSFSVAARFARKNEIGIINPLSRRENIAAGNPFVLKTQVSGAGIATKLSSFILSKYPTANIITVRNDNKEMKSIVADFTSQIKTSLANQSFRGNIQDATYATEMMAGVAKKLKPNVKNIIVFFSNNKNNVPSFVSLLNPLSKSNDILLMGMDGWEEFGLETEFLVNLDYHQVTSAYIDYDSERVKQFITQFRNKYGAVPLATKHAFLGYDIGWYFLTSLMWYGDKYIESLPDYKGNGLQYDFKFSALKPGEGLQNQEVNIVKLLDYKMVKVY